MKRQSNNLIKLLLKKNRKLALTESMTSGLAAYKLASCKGASKALTGSVVCYSEQAKIQFLGISKKLISRYTCESRQVTKSLVYKLKKKIRADIYASITGLASESSNTDKNKPVGTVYIGVLYNGKYHAEKRLLKGNPKKIKTKACIALHDLVTSVLKKQ